MTKRITFLLPITLFLVLSCKRTEPTEKVDHIILVVNNLEKGMAEFKALTGIEPVLGGVHPNSFTQNALVALDKSVYIEILAPRTDVDSIPEWIMQFESLTPGGWAATTYDVAKTQQTLVGLGFTVTEPQSGARSKPDGTTLSWTTFGVRDKDTLVYPFFIQWGVDVVHPSISSPSGCSLVSLQVTTSDSENFKKLNDALSLGVRVVPGDENSLSLSIHSPRGEVTFPVRDH
jgi:hypothetical protein